MLRVGLTGGIGSGKTVVAQSFSELGIPIIDSDQIARDITEPGQFAYRDIVAKFGEQILLPDLQLDRRRMRDAIFNDPNLKRWLEELLHPIIKAAIHDQTTHLQSPYCIIDIPLLVEANARGLVDRVLVVTASDDLRIKRTMARDNITAEDVKKIMAAQASTVERLAIADDVIDNSGDLAQLQVKIRELDDFYRGLVA